MQSLTTSWTGASFGLSAQQVRDIVNGVSSPMQTMTPRYKLLDQTLSGVPTGAFGPYDDAGDITQWVIPGANTITNDTTRPTHRQLDITLKEDASLLYDPLVHLVQVFWDYWASPGVLAFEVPLGIFGFIIPDRSLADSANTLKGSMLDLTSQIAQCYFGSSWTIPAGTNYVTAIATMLSCDNVPAGQVDLTGAVGTGATPAGVPCGGPGIAQSRILITACSQTTPSTITFPWNTDFLTAINQLLTSINYYPLWIDETGNVRADPLPQYNVSVPQNSWTYATDATSTIQGSVSWQVTNQADLANCVAVRAENPNTGVFASTRYNNNNTLSRLCISRLGRTITKPIQDDKIPDQPSCDLRAYVELQWAAMKAEQITFTSWPQPFAQSHDHVQLTVTDTAGNTELTSPVGYEEFGWSLDLDRRLMQHTMGKSSII